jgi:26S proteasome regulatory subunit N2
MVTLWCRCIPDGKYQQAMGMAVECSRLDKLEEAIVQCDSIHGALWYFINISHQYVSYREYRCEVRQIFISSENYIV